MGLIQAVNRYDAENGADFLAFAVPTMMGEVRRYFRDHGWSVKVPRRMKELGPQLNRARDELAQTLERAPTASEIAQHLGTRPRRGGAGADRLQRVFHPVVRRARSGGRRRRPMDDRSEAASEIWTLIWTRCSMSKQLARSSRHCLNVNKQCRHRFDSSRT